MHGERLLFHGGSLLNLQKCSIFKVFRRKFSVHSLFIDFIRIF